MSSGYVIDVITYNFVSFSL